MRRGLRSGRWAAACATMLVMATGQARGKGVAAVVAPSHESVTARTDYLLGCGGCHGEGGHSSPAIVPDLVGQVGYFMCTSAGRAYLIRLPNVAFARLSSADLARLMNFVVFDLGAGSAPAGARRFTAQEVRDLRREPLQPADFMTVRQNVVQGVVKACPRAEAGSSFAPNSPYVMTNHH